MNKFFLTICLTLSFVCVSSGQALDTKQSPTEKKEEATRIEFQYKLLATNRTSTMEKEMNEAAAAGYKFLEVVSGETAFGGAEALVIMARKKDENHPRYDYKLLATTKTGTMQKELQDAGDAGFEHRGQSVFKRMWGGPEVIVILERDKDTKPEMWDYKLLATNKTSTMQKEVMEATAAGYQFVGFSTGSTFFGGNEVVTIMRRPRKY